MGQWVVILETLPKALTTAGRAKNNCSGDSGPKFGTL